MTLCKDHIMTDHSYKKYFDDFRPYNQSEVKEALKRLAANDTFIAALKFFFKDKSDDDLRKRIKNLDSTYDFQTKIMLPAVEQIKADTMQEISHAGVSRLNPNEVYTYISNHRDIFLDASLNLYILHLNGFKTAEITFGDNLMKNPVIADVGKINKMFKVYRSGKPKELMEKTAQLSEYIAYTQAVKRESIWIAQRGGRTKDGNDQTQYGVLKMLIGARKGNTIEQLKSLNIVPVTVSYEYEPNDYLKVREVFLSQKGPYKKAPGEDLNSIIDGIQAQKGHVHFEFGEPICELFDSIPQSMRPNAQVKEAASLIDRIMYRNYKLFPNNYIAADMLTHSDSYTHKYSPAQKEAFTDYMHRRLAKIEFSDPALENLFLKMYANPLFNLEKLQSDSE